jgi:hypothetical protein
LTEEKSQEKGKKESQIREKTPEQQKLCEKQSDLEKNIRQAPNKPRKIFYCSDFFANAFSFYTSFAAINAI